jgi:hypothetical protein
MFKEVKQAYIKCKGLPMSSTFPSSAELMLMTPQKKPTSTQQKPSSEINKKPVRPQIQAIPLVYQGPLANGVSCQILFNVYILTSVLITFLIAASFVSSLFCAILQQAILPF